jgi:hypothetical protein
VRGIGTRLLRQGRLLRPTLLLGLLARHALGVVTVKAPCHADVPELAVMLDRVQRELVRRASVGNADAARVLDAAAAAARRRALDAVRMIERRSEPDGGTTDGTRAQQASRRQWTEEEQRVTLALRSLGAPTTARAIAPLAGLDVNRVRCALIRLRNRDVVHHAGSAHWQLKAADGGGT